MDEDHPVTVALIDHVVIRVRNLDTMIAFYEDVLGCRLERGPGDEGLAQLRAGQSLIDLVDAHGPIGRRGGAPPDGKAPNMEHVCLQIRPWNQRAILAHLDAAGVEYGEIEERYGAGGTGPSVYIRDPEGNTIELKAATDTQPRRR